MNAREDWLKARQSGIGGSDIGAILGLSPFKTPLDVYLDKTQPAGERAMTDAMHFGVKLESIIADEYAERNKRPVQRINRVLKKPGAEWMLANIDRAIIAPGSRARVADDGGTLLGVSGILECKTASAYKAGEWGRDGDDDAVPASYAAQAMWYMAVTGTEWCDVAVLIGGQRYLDKRIERDDDTIKAMIERADAFWRGHVMAGIAPEPVNESDLKRLYPDSHPGKIITASESLHHEINRLRDIRQELKRLEADEAEALVTIKSAMGDAESAEYMGVTLATWKSASQSRKTDWKAAYYDAINAMRSVNFEWEKCFNAPGPVDLSVLSNSLQSKYTTTQPGSRRFLLKGEK